MAAGRESDGRGAAAALALLAGLVFSVCLNQPGWFDNEGRFAEGAREMIVRSDWVTPYVNDVPLLTKPPLTQWLAALVFAVAGPTEHARIVSIVAAMLTIVATCRLGARLYGPRAGLVAGAMLATTVGFVLEARTLRPDGLVIAAVTGAIFSWHVAETGIAARRRRWLLLMWASLGVGMLAKGLVPAAVAGVPIGVMTLRRHGLAGLRRLEPMRGLVVLAAIVLPWHVAAALANPGFAWDYVVNQHLLFAFDKKEPRDSVGDPVQFFLAAFVGRSAPWVLFLPFVLPEGVARLLGRAPEIADGTLLLWLWVAGTVGMFALVPSRLEHYTLPALPGVAPLAARAWDRIAAGRVGAGARVYFALVALVLLAGGAFGIVHGRELLAEEAYWLPQAPGLMALVVPAALVAGFAGALLAVALASGRATALVGAIAVGVTPFLAILVRALIEAEALFSWRPVARSLARVVPDTEVVFESPIEYQVVGGLDFYLGRSVTMLEPRGGYVPPTYLEGRMQGVFITRDELKRRWHSGRPLAFVSDPQSRRDTATGLVDAPYYVLDRFGDRWVLTNVPVSASR